MHKMHYAFATKHNYILQFLKKVKEIRVASNFKRPPFPIKQEQLQELSKDLFEGRTGLTVDEWTEARQILIKNNKYINENNIDSVIISVCKTLEQLPLAKNYIDFLRNNGFEPNVATQGRFLRIYNVIYHGRGGDSTSLTHNEQEEILKIYKYLREKYDVLDATTAENLIFGLVATNEWEQSIDLLDMIKITSTPSNAVYTELIMKAFSVGDMNVGWNLLEELLMQRKQPKCEIFECYLNQISKNNATFKENLEKLLNFMQKHELVFTERVYNYIQELIKKLPTTLSLALVNLERGGRCNFCGNLMEKIFIRHHEFEQLRETFLNAVLIRNDIYQKSTPEEVERFKSFIERTQPYDCVIDGLNVSYSQGAQQSPAIMAKLLVIVVKHFAKTNKKLLILGRKHMNSWPKQSMQYIRRNAEIFLTNNLSQDDPFLLYATLRSGPNTDFLSRDLMRSHSHLLGAELKTIFRRWQQLHQHILVTQTAAGTVIIKNPIRHFTSAHKTIEGYWHIPYEKQYMPHYTETFEPSTNWICLRIL